MQHEIEFYITWFLIQKDGYLVDSVSDRKLNFTKHWPVQFVSTVVLVVLVVVVVVVVCMYLTVAKN